MIEKLYRPVYRFLTQDHDGTVSWHLSQPVTDERFDVHDSLYRFRASEGARNENWIEAVIDMEAVDRGEYGYTFDDGILKRVDTDCGNDAAKDRYKL